MSNYQIITEDSLAHHGIKGQRHGVRNAEWYPIDEYKAHLARVNRLSDKKDKKEAKASSLDKKSAKYKKKSAANRFERKSARYQLKSSKLKGVDDVKSAKYQTKSDKYAIKSKKIESEPKEGLKKYFDNKSDKLKIKSDKVKEQIAKLQEKIDKEQIRLEELDSATTKKVDDFIEKKSSVKKEMTDAISNDYKNIAKQISKEMISDIERWNGVGNNPAFNLTPTAIDKISKKVEENIKNFNKDYVMESYKEGIIDFSINGIEEYSDYAPLTVLYDPKTKKVVDFYYT